MNEFETMYPKIVEAVNTPDGLKAVVLLLLEASDLEQLDFIKAHLPKPCVLSNSNRVNVKETSMNVPNFSQMLDNIAQEKSAWRIKQLTTELWIAYYKQFK